MNDDLNSAVARGGRNCILVLGMHRSGTSAVTRLVSMLGAKLPQRLMSGGVGNEAGHWEPIRLVEYHEKFLAEVGSAWHDWTRLDVNRLTTTRSEMILRDILEIIEEDYSAAPLIVVKDPRICRFASFFSQALEHAGYSVLVIVPFRNPLAVMDSLISRREFWPADSDRTDAALLWLCHVLAAEKYARGKPSAFISFEALLADWKHSLGRLSDQLGNPFPTTITEIEADAAQFLDPRLHHQMRKIDEIRLEPELEGWLGDAYLALRDLEMGRKTQLAHGTFDRLRAEFDGALHYLTQSKRVRRDLQVHNHALEADKVLLRQELALREDELVKLASAYEAERQAHKRLQEWRATRESHYAMEIASTHWQYQNSTSWKLTKPIRRVRQVQIEFGRLLKVIPAAVRLGGGVAPTTRKTFRVYRTTGWAGLKHRAAIAEALTSTEFRPRVRSLVSSPVDRPRAEPSKQHEWPSESTRSSLAARDELTGSDTASRQFQKPSSSQDKALLSSDEVLKVLERQLPLAEQAKFWKRPEPRNLMTAKEVEAALKRMALNCKGLALVFTHDDYRKVVGGIQLCVQLEQRSFIHEGFLYLSLHPQQPLPILAAEANPDRFVYVIVANGEVIGSTTASTLIWALASCQWPDERTVCVVHSLIGHAPEVLSHFHKQLPFDRAIFWVHDYFAACPNHLLLRNGLSFCGAPDANSVSCRVCVYGEERVGHIARVRQLFEAVAFDLVSPSQFALNLWQVATGFPCRTTKVIPHIDLAEGGVQKVGEHPRRSHPIRLAFLGHPALHKGWPSFLELAEKFASDQRYEFHHFGQEKAGPAFIKFSKVCSSADKPDAMMQALISHEIDVALLWPLWPETFSFTSYECLQSGTMIVTNELSGNIQSMVKANGIGIILECQRELIELLSGDTLVRVVAERRAAGRRIRFGQYSNLSRGMMG